MKKILKKIWSINPKLVLLFISLLSLSSFNVFSTFSTVSNQEALVIEVEDLDPYEYGDIKKEFEDNNSVELTLACVPVDLLLFEFKEGVEMDRQLCFEMIKSKIEQTLSSETPQVTLTELTTDTFNTKCSEARNGRH